MSQPVDRDLIDRWALDLLDEGGKAEVDAQISADPAWALAAREAALELHLMGVLRADLEEEVITLVEEDAAWGEAMQAAIGRHETLLEGIVPPVAAPVRVAAPAASWWSRLAASFRWQPAFGAALVAAVALFFVVPRGPGGGADVPWQLTVEYSPTEVRENKKIEVVRSAARTAEGAVAASAGPREVRAPGSDAVRIGRGVTLKMSLVPGTAVAPDGIEVLVDGRPVDAHVAVGKFGVVDVRLLFEGPLSLTPGPHEVRVRVLSAGLEAVQPVVWMDVVGDAAP